MKYLIVVPARGGSKGIPKKNIYPLVGKPLLSYTLEVIQRAGLADTDVAVSTDSEEIAEVARSFSGVEVVHRPAEIAGDRASTEAALLHALDMMQERYGVKYDAVLTLQPTSPLRQPETLKQFIKTYEEQKDRYDAILSLHEDRSDFWVKKGDGVFDRRDPAAPRRRQEREPLYVENSAYYITSVAALRETHSVLGNRVNGFVISDREGIDINEPVDLVIAEAFLGDADI